MSKLLLGPRAGSYRPPMLGRLRSSNRTGLTIVLTDSFRMSSVDRKENDILVTVDDSGFDMFILLLDYMQATLRQRV
jgi:hypothetical protein